MKFGPTLSHSLTNEYWETLYRCRASGDIRIVSTQVANMGDERKTQEGGWMRDQCTSKACYAFY